MIKNVHLNAQQARTGRLWTYVHDDRASGNATPHAVWFQYSPNRKGEQLLRQRGD